MLVQIDAVKATYDWNKNHHQLDERKAFFKKTS
jgi:hypothetical protein